jgi:hypothetical protein
MRFTGVPLRASSAARTLLATVAVSTMAMAPEPSERRVPRMASCTCGVNIGQHDGIEHAVAAPVEAFAVYASSTEPVVPPITVR